MLSPYSLRALTSKSHYFRLHQPAGGERSQPPPVPARADRGHSGRRLVPDLRRQPVRQRRHLPGGCGARGIQVMTHNKFIAKAKPNDIMQCNWKLIAQVTSACQESAEITASPDLQNCKPIVKCLHFCKLNFLMFLPDVSANQDSAERSATRLERNVMKVSAFFIQFLWHNWVN